MRTRDLARAALFAALIAICSWISIPTAVPFTLQTFAVFLALGVLGGKLGTLSVAVYLLLGAVGLPVFAGFQGGLGALLGATGGYLPAASELTDVEYTVPDYHFEQGVYDKRVYNGWGHPEPDYALKFGPNIKDWPEQPALTDDLLVKIVSYITDPVTTTDELIPSGETSSFRSNPLRLAEFTLSRKDPAYVPNAKAVKALDEQRKAGELPAEVARVYDDLKKLGYAPDAANTNIGSAIFANKPGDGSAREQAASCQRVLGGAANFACEYATKRYRSNCINWGMLPFLVENPGVLDNGDYVYLPGVRKALLEAADELDAVAVKPDGGLVKFTVKLGAMTDAERRILADGCLINYYKNN